MDDFYHPRETRRPDWQYQQTLAKILATGELVKDNPQDAGALTCFGTLPQMIFDLRNGIPVITERRIPWQKAVAEIIAFINGARTIEQIESYGCDFWKDYRGKGSKYGLEPNDMGPGSYGPTFHDYEVPGGGTMNQMQCMIEQIRSYPGMRTHKVIAWKPYYTGRGKNRQVIVAPCHGDQHYRVINGRLHLTMNQRSADVPIGVPFNMVQYSALLLMMCQVTGYAPGNYIHGFIGDAHIYENQVPAVRELIQRDPRPFPVLRLDPSVTDLFDFRVEHFTLEEYDTHPGMKIPYSP